MGRSQGLTLVEMLCAVALAGLAGGGIAALAGSPGTASAIWTAIAIVVVVMRRGATGAGHVPPVGAPLIGAAVLSIAGAAPSGCS